ncbi:hypothetical protein Tco_0445067 [Tanacetum coccineum]
MTNKIDTMLKAITNRIAGTLPSDTVKNPKLGTHLISSTRSYPTIDPQCSSHPSNSINAIKTHFNEATISQTSLRQPEIETKPLQLEQAKPTLEDEFQDLHLNLLVLEVLAHAPIYNSILDKYIESLELGKNGSVYCSRRNTRKDGRLWRRITRSVLGVKGVNLGEEEAPYWTTLGKRCHLPGEWEISRDAELNPFKDTLVFMAMVEFLRAIPINLKNLPKPFNQFPPLGRSPKEKVQERSSTWTTSTTLDM